LFSSSIVSNNRILNKLMDYLDKVIQDMILVSMERMGDSWAHSSPDINNCDKFWGANLKEFLNKPLPVNL
jgi:hypothetical protein